MQSLADWLDHAGQLNTANIDLSLNRVKAVWQRLFPKGFQPYLILVAGTNGKGSTVCLLEHALHLAGYQVGSMTSPHLIAFNERFKLNLNPANDATITTAFAAVENARGDVPLTYFEFITLAGYYVLASREVDVAVVEVGLGGRLDATNVAQPDLSIITHIALDHQNFLGNTLDAIAKEKAGIFRANKPAVVGDPHMQTSMKAIAEQLQTNVFQSGREYRYIVESGAWDWHCGHMQFNRLPIPQMQLQNAATAMMALQCLPKKFKVSDMALRQALLQAKPMARQQFVSENIIIDVAHNPDSADALARFLKERPCAGRTFAVVGMLKDKDIVGTLLPLLPQVDEWYAADVVTHGFAKGRELKALDLADILHQQGANVAQLVSSDVVNIVKQVLPRLTEMDRLLVFGSFYLVGELLSAKLF